MSRITGIEAVISKLKEAGLTTTEAEVYIAVIKGEANAKKLSDASGVPYSKIHTVLSKLVRKSLIIENEGRPSIYASKTPAEAIADYKRMLINDLERRLKEAEEALGSIEAARDSERPDILIIKNQESIMRRTYKTLNDAKQEVKFALPFVPGWVTVALMPVLVRLKSDKICLKLLLSTTSPREEICSLSSLGEVRVREKMFGGGIIADNSEVLLFIASDVATPSLAIWSNHMNLVHVAKTYFDNLWDSSFEPLI